MTLGTALRQGHDLLAKAGVSNPRLTAEVLLAHALHLDRAYLFAYPEHVLSELEWIHYGRYLHERSGRKPLQYITRVQEFYGRAFRVTPDVLIPRPETELLVERALTKARTGARIADIGTGSGAIAITLSIEAERSVIAVDISQPALAVARANATALSASVEFLSGDLLEAFADRSVDLLVSNPPYVAEEDRATLAPEVELWEPAQALFAGPAGLAIYRRLIPEATRVLRPGGSLMMELGAGQDAAVRSLFGGEWLDLSTVCDLAGIPRVISGTFSPSHRHW